MATCSSMAEPVFVDFQLPDIDVLLWMEIITASHVSVYINALPEYDELLLYVIRRCICDIIIKLESLINCDFMDQEWLEGLPA